MCPTTCPTTCTSAHFPLKKGRWVVSGAVALFVICTVLLSTSFHVHMHDMIGYIHVAMVCRMEWIYSDWECTST